MKNVEINFGGLKITAEEATPQEVAELKKFLDEQNPIKVKLVPQPYQPYPWTIQPYIYPQYPYYEKTTTTTGAPFWKDITITCNSLTRSNNPSVLGDDGNLIKYDYSTYKN